MSFSQIIFTPTPHTSDAIGQPASLEKHLFTHKKQPWKFAVNHCRRLLSFVLLVLVAQTSFAAGTVTNPIVIDISTVANGTYAGYTVTANAITITEDGYYLFTGSSTTRNIVTNPNLPNLNIFLSDVSIVTNNATNSPLHIGNNTNVNLTLLGNNTLDALNQNNTTGMAGLFVSTTASVTINGPGELIAKGAAGGSGGNIGGGAGIGGNGTNSKSSGAITINGGTIIATGGNTQQNAGAGAGIGGGGGNKNEGGDVIGVIIINGGNITATGGNSPAQGSGGGAAAGIGGGGAGSTAEGGSNVEGIYINGGTVNAKGGDSGNGVGAAGIGGGASSSTNNAGKGGLEDDLIQISPDADITAQGGTGSGTNPDGADIGDAGGAGAGTRLALSVLNEPADVEVTIGESTTLLYRVAAQPAEATITYQWYQSTTGANSGGTPIAGETSATLTLANDALGEYYYYCVAQATYQTQTPLSRTSRAAKVTVVEEIRKSFIIESEDNFMFENRVEGYLIPPSIVLSIFNDGNYTFPDGNLPDGLKITYTGDDFLDAAPDKLATLAQNRRQNITLTAKRGLPAGTYTSTITISDGDYSQQVTVRFTVTACEITGVSIGESSSVKLNYIEGENLDLSGLYVELTYNGDCEDEIKTIPYNEFPDYGLSLNYTDGQTLTMEDDGKDLILSISYGEEKTETVGTLIITPKSCSEEIVFHPLPSLCGTEDVLDLSYYVESTIEGVFSGTGVSGNLFDASIAGVGDTEITYTIETAVCFLQETEILRVHPKPQPLVIIIEGCPCEEVESQKSFFSSMKKSFKSFFFAKKKRNNTI